MDCVEAFDTFGTADAILRTGSAENAINAFAKLQQQLAELSMNGTMSFRLVNESSALGFYCNRARN